MYSTAPLISNWKAESKQWQQLTTEKSLRARQLSFAFGFNINRQESSVHIMVISNRTLRKRLHGQFHRHVFAAEWVWIGIFCFASFYSTFKLIFIFDKFIKFLLQKLLTPDLNFPMSRVVKIWTAAAIFRRDTNCPNQFPLFVFYPHDTAVECQLPSTVVLILMLFLY